MVVVDPRRRPGRTDSLAGSIDLGPTLLELADVPAYDGIGGRSLVPVLDDAGASVRDEVLIEDDFPGALVLNLTIPSKTRTLVTADLRLTRHSDGSEQLFDMAKPTPTRWRHSAAPTRPGAPRCTSGWPAAHDGSRRPRPRHVPAPAPRLAQRERLLHSGITAGHQENQAAALATASKRKLVSGGARPLRAALAELPFFVDDTRRELDLLDRHLGIRPVQ